MGVVFKARQVSLNRIVAVKMILSGLLALPEDVERFHVEAEAAANLDHPGIVPIFEVGEHDGQHYFSMGYVDGSSLSARVAEGPMPPRDAAQLVRTLCDAVQYAHEHDVIHRDLKPPNILLDREGRPRVTDFGLAKRVQDDSGRTATGQVVGTPAYMPPEQAAGKLDAIGPAADVYALGAILYALLTGRPPFQSVSTMDTLRHVLESEPLAPSALTAGIPRDLETIVLKCLQKSIPQRYASARALADDLQRFLDGRPILARPIGRAARILRWCKRQPVVASLIAAIIVCLAAGTGIATYFALAERDRAVTESLARKQESEARARADEQTKLALETLNMVVFNIQTGLENVPGAQRVRRKLIETAVAGLQKVARTVDTNRGADHGIVWSQISLGDLFLLVGDTKLASEQFKLATELALKRAQADPSDAGAQRDLSISYIGLGDLNLRLGNALGAHDDYQKSLNIRLKRAQSDPSNAQAQRDLSISYNKLGNVNLLLGKASCAQDKYQKSLDIALKQAQSDPSDAQAQRDLSVSYNTLGDVNRQLGNGSAARDDYQKGLNIRLKLAQADPSDAETQRDLLISYNKLGNVNLLLGNASGAHDDCQKGLLIALKLAQADPSDAQAQRDLSISYNKLGDVNLQSGNGSAARDDYQKNLDIALKLAQADPSDAQAQADLAYSYGCLGSVEMSLKAFANAGGWFEKGIGILSKLDAEGKIAGQPLYQGWLKDQREKLEACKSTLRGVEETRSIGARKVGGGSKCDWSPEGAAVVVTKLKHDASDVGLEIHLLANGGVHDLVQPGKDPAWSPAANGPIAFVRGSVPAKEEIWLIDADGTHERKVGRGGYPNWSGDGKTLYFHDRDKRAIMAVSTNSDEPAPQVVLKPVPSSYPAVSPDGGYVAYITAGNGLVVVKCPGGEFVKNWPLGGKVGGGLVAWHPKGKQLTYSGFAHDSTGLWLADLDTGKSRKIIPGRAWRSAWSHDGTQFLFAIDDDIYVVDADKLPAP
jgi:tetratricopeptide (TPR) repeat protein